MADHAAFIIAAYAVTGVVLAGTVAAILLDHRAQQRALANLTARLDRRDGRPATASMQGRDDDEP